MIWHKAFWIWFATMSLLAVVLLLEEPTSTAMVFGSSVVALGLLKLACEGSEKGSMPRIRKDLLDRLKK
jgi:hypothetical protein